MLEALDGCCTPAAADLLLAHTQRQAHAPAHARAHVQSVTMGIDDETLKVLASGLKNRKLTLEVTKLGDYEAAGAELADVQETNLDVLGKVRAMCAPAACARSRV